ncbi:Succinate semialdehyde dehydrogenase [NAD(P)+] Sad [bacterium HR15]|nr:Succinate semialdehyde dehydrogenase [NAD(P)+] Sad [bacterium HR15]
MIASVNPATGETLRVYSPMDADTVDAIVQDVHRAYLEWRTTSFAERAAPMHRVAQLLRERKEEYARLITEEMGKPIVQARAEIEKCAWGCDYFAEHAESMLAPLEVPTEAQKSYVTFQPLGAILAIMPWNFPFWQVFRFAAPAMMAGNSVVLKHAPSTPACALAIESLMREAGFPAHLLRAVLVENEQVEPIIRHPRIAAVTLTGSPRAGRTVARVAGEELKKCVLELGGSDPAVILADADLTHTLNQCATGRLINSGQSCIAAKRFIVEQPLYEAFVEGFLEQMRGQKMGDPFDESTTIGPMAREDLRANLHRQVQQSVQQGARCLLGGEIPAGRGFFYPPTVLVDVRRGMPVWDEETFGPVAPIVAAPNRAEAIRMANDTPYGLGASVYTRDLVLGEQIAAHALEAGNCFVNSFVFSDPRLPFGGIKQSGYGRELGLFGIREFTNIKTVYVARV